jgi:hypothetical protein
MDISNYKNLKESNNISLSKIGESFAIVVNKYNPDTGVKVAPIIEAVGKENVLALKENLLKQLEQVEEVLKDMDNLEKPPKEEPIK